MMKNTNYETQTMFPTLQLRILFYANILLSNLFWNILYI
jgi:hypothetical protein